MTNVYERKEIDEAIEAAQITLTHLKNAEQYLGSAEGWGLWDMFGGGLISTWAKHSKMDAAESEIDQAKQCMYRLSKELRDVGYFDELDIQVDEFMRFADYWWDGFFVDWMVQDKINEAQRRVREAIYKVEVVLDRLRRM